MPRRRDPRVRRARRRSGAESAERALRAARRAEFDLVVSDVIMPGLSGLELLEPSASRHASLPVVLVTGAGTYETLSQALTRGRGRPRHEAVRARRPAGRGRPTRSSARRAAATSCASGCSHRRSRARSRTRSRRATPTCTATASGSPRSPCASPSCSGCRPDEIETIRLGAILHDIGKIGIPGPRAPEAGPARRRRSARIIETHPEIGDKLLEPLDLLARRRPIVRHHHERWDGAGLPGPARRRRAFRSARASSPSPTRSR